MKLFPVSSLLILSLFLSHTAESYDVEDNAIAMTFLDIYGEEAKIDEAVTGDFNGDGVMDLAVCARSFSTSTATALGAVGIYTSGFSAAPQYFLSQGETSADILITGSMAYGYFAYACASGDINNDGIDDLFIAQTNLNYAEYPYTEFLYVIPGSADLQSAAIQDLIDNAHAIAYKGAGYSVANAGDIDRDGYTDLIVGTYYPYLDLDADSYFSGAYLVYGAPSLPLGQTIDLSTQATFKSSEDYSDYAGISVGAAGDVNADGFGDFLIGAATYSATGTEDGETGAAYLVLGQASRFTQYDLANALLYTGKSYGSSAGITVSTAGDPNTDGYSDFLIGAYKERIDSEYRGAAYLVLGSATPVEQNLSEAIAFTGAEKGACAGLSLSGGGDHNRDGIDDFWIGTPYSHYRGDSYYYAYSNDVRSAYLLYGPPPLAGMTLTMDVEYELLGAVSQGGDDHEYYDLDEYSSFLSALPDMNRNGIDDVIIGASGYWPNGRILLAELEVNCDHNDRDGDNQGSCDHDCDLDDPTTYCGAEEVNDGKDNDCNGLIDDTDLGTPQIDDDGDGYCEDPTTCTDGSLPGDCSDLASDINPGETETNDSLDNDCDCEIDEGTSCSSQSALYKREFSPLSRGLLHSSLHFEETQALMALLNRHYNPVRKILLEDKALQIEGLRLFEEWQSAIERDPGKAVFAKMQQDTAIWLSSINTKAQNPELNTWVTFLKTAPTRRDDFFRQLALRLKSKQQSEGLHWN